MKILFISEKGTFPQNNMEELENVFKEKGMGLDIAEKPLVEHKGGGYDAVILAGDENSVVIDDIDLLKNILYEFMKKEKIVAAIDCAPALLAMAGVLEGKCATVNEKKNLGRQLHDLGALFFSESVVVDRNIVTANSPLAGVEFANTIIELLNSDNLDNRITCN